MGGDGMVGLWFIRGSKGLGFMRSYWHGTEQGACSKEKEGMPVKLSYCPLNQHHPSIPERMHSLGDEARGHEDAGLLTTRHLKPASSGFIIGVHHRGSSSGCIIGGPGNSLQSST